MLNYKKFINSNSSLIYRDGGTNVFSIFYSNSIPKVQEGAPAIDSMFKIS